MFLLKTQEYRNMFVRGDMVLPMCRVVVKRKKKSRTASLR